jgi:hypothetical protein
MMRRTRESRIAMTRKTMNSMTKITGSRMMKMWKKIMAIVALTRESMKKRMFMKMISRETTGMEMADAVAGVLAG